MSEELVIQICNICAFCPLVKCLGGRHISDHPCSFPIKTI